MKRKFMIFTIFAVVLTTLAACGGGSPAGSNDESGLPTYRTLYSGELTTLNYIVSSSSNEQKVLSNVVDGLLDYDKYGIVTPSLATEWSANEDSTVWTFKIREGVKWVDYEGKEVADVTAADWVTGAKYANEATTNSAGQYMFEFVKNANKYFEQTSYVMAAEGAVQTGEAATVEEYYAANDINPSDFITFEDVGVKALDTYTLEYTMEQPTPFFESVLSYAPYRPVYGPFLEENGENFGISNEYLLYNGAYIISVYEPNSRRELTINPTYWDKDSITIGKLEARFNAKAVDLEPTMLLKGELDEATIGPNILDSWLKDEDKKDKIRPGSRDISYSYFFSFNFEPRFDNSLEPDNWLKAVNNENFRKSIFAGLDREKALAVDNPADPMLIHNNTVTPPTFSVAEGKDYVKYGALEAYTDGNAFDTAKALEYKALAMTELKAEGATFPVQILMPFNPSVASWGPESTVIEQQLEGLLGKDYIDIVVEAGPTTGFLSEVRSGGDYALMKTNWGADYADPQTWTDPFKSGNSFGFFYTSEDKLIGGEPVTNKSATTQQLVDEYYALVDAAKQEDKENAARFEKFAAAESFLIDHAFIIPFSVDGGGYVVSRLDPFTSHYSNFGMAGFSYKGQTLLDKPMGPEEYAVGYEKWQQEWEAAQQAAANK